MGIDLDHFTVPASDMRASAEQLASILGVRAAPAAIGPFHAVHVNDGLTLDFDQVDGPLPVRHYCFRVDDASFDGIVARLAAAGVPYRSLPFGPDDGQVNTRHGGRIIYWSVPDGHVWEALTVSYARPARGGVMP